MNECCSQPRSQRGAVEFLATVWPVPTATDSEQQRRKKLAVRSGHLAMAVMVLAAVGGTVEGWRP